MVKRYGNLYPQICSEENIRLAIKNSRKGKLHLEQVREVDADPDKYVALIKDMLENKTYKSGEYRPIQIRDPKERTVYDCDYFPHRIVHWALIQVIRPILMNCIGPHSFGAMKGRGPHQALTLLDEYLRKDKERTEYCLKIDIKKYFPSIPKDKLIEKLERKIKDPDVIWLCKEIVYGFPGDGLPIGNYTSQYFANYYFYDIYHDLKHNYHCKHILGYMDDWIILGESKRWLRRVKRRLESLLNENGLRLKGNWQIFPASCGIPFLGYVTYPTHRRVKHRVKVNIHRACNRIMALTDGNAKLLTKSMMGTLASYHGVLNWCDGYGLEDATIRRIHTF